MAKDQDFEKDFVRLKNVSKIYRMGEVEIRAVDKIEFTIDKGEFVVVVGPSGAGKTTVLNILGGMDTVTSGDVLVDGENIAKYSQRKLTGYRRDDIGFVFQFYNLVPNLTAKENVELALQICKEPLDAVQVLKEVGLGDRLDNFPAQLSGGEQQRVAIARALINKPKILLADEPTSALDVTTQAQIVRQMMELRDDFGTGIIVVTHNIGVAAYMADKLLVMRQGKVVDSGHREDILHNPQSEYTKNLLASVPALKGERYV